MQTAVARSPERCLAVTSFLPPKPGEVSPAVVAPLLRYRTIPTSMRRINRQLNPPTQVSERCSARTCETRSTAYILWLYFWSAIRFMPQAILKWGNSLAFRIPAAIAKQMEIAEGEEVEFYIDGKRLVIEKAAKMPKFTHQDLLKSLRKAKKDLIDLGTPRGKEIL